MANFTVSLNLKTRPAIYTASVDRPKLSVVKDTPYSVDVFGIYQVAIEDEVDAYFVITLPTGQCTYAGVEEIRFTDCGGDMYE